MTSLPAGLGECRTLSPFGLEVAAAVSHTNLGDVPHDWLRQAVDAHRVVVLRGFRAPSDEDLRSFGEQFGEILEWEFGAINELQAREDARNYLYTNRAVPFHWDGAFAGRVPHYILFHCVLAPPEGTGGETLFCDTIRLLQRATPEQRQRWQRVAITYSTEKVVHYGGTFTAPMMGSHPVTGESVLRFAEPVEDVNPVRLAIDGIPPAAQAEFLAQMRRLLYDAAVCYAHAWRTGDIVLADNHALLHGRRAFRQPATRHLRRINIL
jgi:alpha-ketoglutarate-dependent taurine dioxygenase